MEILNDDFHNEKLLDQRKKLNEFTNNLWKIQIIKANNKYLDEKHTEFIRSNSERYSAEKLRIIDEVFEFLKDNE